MSRGPSSRASPRVNECSADLVMQYTSGVADDAFGPAEPIVTNGLPPENGEWPLATPARAIAR